MGNIVLLDDLTINKIAAGEVIERPASVIKELVENSIDAGANNITVEIKNGGISYIRVTDNGKGIAPDDLEIAFERHATSKIRKADDLNYVTSMGFRGEALASIAAIANVELTSKTASQDTGYKITVEGGDILNKVEVGCQTGTNIVVRNLFYNTPVRYKFLKKDYTEAGYIEDAITRIALVNPSIAIKLINTGKTVIQTNGNGDMKSVIYSIYGKEIAQNILPVDYTYDDIEVTGVVGKPQIARSNRAYQLFFVNKRYIKDKMLSSATEQAFKGLITIGKHGFVILNIKMDPSKVDVNVHPAKLEVRFQDEGKIFQSVYHAIKNTLLKAELVADTDKENAEFRKMAKKENSGLFEFRKNETKKIEKYNDEESKIKTHFGTPTSSTQVNAETVKPKVNVGSGGPVNTADILEQLRKLKENLQNEISGDKKSEKENVEKNDTKPENENPVKNDTKTENESVLENNVKSDRNTENAENTENNTIVKKENTGNINDSEKLNTENSENENIESEQLEKPQNNDSENSDSQNSDSKEEKIEEVKKQEENIEKQEETINEEENEAQQKLNEINKEIKKLENLKEEPETPIDFGTMYEKIFGTKPIATEEELENADIPKNTIVNYESNPEGKETNPNGTKDLKENNVSVFDQNETYKKPVYKFIGIIFKTYIIIEMDNEMYMIDQHAAHERILYEKVKKNYYSNNSGDSQLLLLPDIITLTHKEMELAKENMDMFKRAGFEIEEFGENTLKLTGVPTICVNLDTKELFLDTLDEINTVSRTSKQEKEERFIATVACKAAVKAGMDLSKEEVDNLIVNLLKLPNPFTCPHGRPTTIKMSRYEIERKFSRK